MMPLLADDQLQVDCQLMEKNRQLSDCRWEGGVSLPTGLGGNKFWGELLGENRMVLCIFIAKDYL